MNDQLSRMVGHIMSHASRLAQYDAALQNLLWTDYCMSADHLNVQQRHHKSKKHHKERPQRQEALTAMSGAYGVSIEDRPRSESRKQPPQQDPDDDSDASGYL